MFQEWYDAGYQRGYAIAVDVISEAEDSPVLLEDILDAENFDREFSPFEHVVNMLNSMDEGAWENFEEGIADGALKALAICA